MGKRRRKARQSTTKKRHLSTRAYHGSPPGSLIDDLNEELSSMAPLISSDLGQGQEDGVEFCNGNYNIEHERAIQEGVNAANLLASRSSEISTSFYERYGPATQTLDSYNHFMNRDLPLILTKNGYFQHDEVVDARTAKVRAHKVRILEAVLEGTTTLVHGETRDGEFFAVYPYEARTRGLTYSRKLYAKCVHEIYDVDSAGGTKLVRQGTDSMIIGEIPIMVKSEFCSLHGFSKDDLIAEHEDPDDPGGYFIIRGKEKVLIGQERPAYNQIFIFQAMSDAKYELEAEIRSFADIADETVSALWIRIPRRKTPSGGGIKSRKDTDGDKFIHVPYVQSGHIKPLGTPNYIHKRKPAIERAFKKQNPGLTVYHVSLRDAFPLFILYKALGFIDDKSIWETFGLSKELNPMFQDSLKSTVEDFIAADIATQKDAIVFIGQLKKQRASEQYLDPETGLRRSYTEDDYYLRGLTFVNEEVFPHIGNGKKTVDNELKAYHLGYMVNRLIQAKLGLIPCDDRDHLQNKRFELPGPLIAGLFKKLLSNMMEEMRRRVCRKIDNNRSYDFFSQIAGTSTLTQGFLYAFSTGNWGLRRQFSSLRVGVSQPLNRLTGIATVSFLRRINSPLNRLSRMIVPRNVHNTAFGYICPVDTPEGQPVGFLKNLAIMAQVSVEADSTPIWKCLRDLKFHPLNAGNLHRLSTETKIFINATLVGTYPSGAQSNSLVEKLKSLRRAWDVEKYNEWKSELRKLREAKKENNQSKGLEPPKLGHGDEDELMESNQLVEYEPMMSTQISITHDFTRREIRIRTDGGRPLRPLFVVEQNHLKIRESHIRGLLQDQGVQPTITWNDLIKAGIIEFIDPSEEENAFIAMYPKKLLHARTPIYRDGVLYHDYRLTLYTHCEIDPGGILGASAAIIPYVNHSQAPRITFQTNIAKQAVGVYALNYASRFDTDSHILLYGGQKPLVTCKAAASFSKFDENPAGQNAIVAILSYTGYNQEDSLIMNTSSIQRGLFRSINFKMKEDSAKINKAFGDQNEAFERPNPDETGSTRGMQSNNLDVDGLPFVGSEMKDGNLIIGKTQYTPKNMFAENVAMGRRAFIKQDISQVFRIPCYSAGSYYDKTGPKDPQNPSRTLVDHVAVFDNEDGYRSCKVRMRSIRCPQIGDKFSSRHGQKGVMGISLDECDMPFTKDGIVPDIIINPHAIPSRMTIGHILEMLDAKGAAFTKISDRPPFCTSKDFTNSDGKDVAFEMGQILKQRGFHSEGMEVLYCGHTGRKLTAQCFIGPCFYQRLKHMTEDKLRFRARGPITTLGRQPIPGQAREGGLRFGEMERDSAIAHGGMQFLRERLFLVSDYYTMTICQHCGQGLTRFASSQSQNSKQCFYKCTFCKSNRDRGNLVEIPYATKLLFQELMCMSVKIAIIPDYTTESNSIVAQEFPKEPVPCCSSRSSNTNAPSVVEGIISKMEDISEYNEPRRLLMEAEIGFHRALELFQAKPGAL